jgi:hypothetical protein
MSIQNHATTILPRAIYTVNQSTYNKIRTKKLWHTFIMISNHIIRKSTTKHIITNSTQPTLVCYTKTRTTTKAYHHYTVAMKTISLMKKVITMRATNNAPRDRGWEQQQRWGQNRPTWPWPTKSVYEKPSHTTTELCITHQRQNIFAQQDHEPCGDNINLKEPNTCRTFFQNVNGASHQHTTGVI